MAKKNLPSPPSSEGNRVRVLVEMRVQRGMDATFALSRAKELAVPGFQLDASYKPVPVRPDPKMRMNLEAAREETVIVRGTIDEKNIKDLESRSNVIRVWRDTKIAPFLPRSSPITPFDCDSGTPKGSIEDVARYLGVDKIWAAGYRGEGMVMGIVDGGTTGEGRPVSSQDVNHLPDPSCPNAWPGRLVPRVIGGWPTQDWGTTGVSWCWHGNMSATDALGMAPEAKIYDIRISDAVDVEALISNAIAGFDWAIDQHRRDGTPQILSNSWGIFMEEWGPDYARDPDHPFTRKVIEAINEGIIVLFAAGNCGQVCPSGRCKGDFGPGKDIWGANGHPMVITVGAANTKGEWIGYSSQGPAALDEQKPDFCSISHFRGYFSSDTGTSAATPIAAGVIALLKQAVPALTQERAKEVLKQTAKNVGSAGWDQHSGSGIIQAKAAYDLLKPGEPEDRCKKYEPYLKYVLFFAYRKPSLHACLCHYVCGKGDKPRCSSLEMTITKRVTNALNLCSHLKEEFCSSLRCPSTEPGLLALGEAATPEEEMAQAELELLALEEVSAPEEMALEEFRAAPGELEMATWAEPEEMARAEMEMAAEAQLQCQNYVPYLKSVIAAASGNPVLRRCLCYYICRAGPRPVCTKAHIDLVRRVIRIMRICPQYRPPFCRGLRCL